MTKIEGEAFTAIAKLQDENRELRLKLRSLKELISASNTVMIFLETAGGKVIDEEYQRLVVDPFKIALAKAKNPSPASHSQTGAGEK